MRNSGTTIAAVLQPVPFPKYVQSYQTTTRTPHYHQYGAGSVPALTRDAVRRLCVVVTMTPMLRPAMTGDAVSILGMVVTMTLKLSANNEFGCSEQIGYGGF